MARIRRISSGGEFEAKVGYCRAVVAGGFVHVAGTVGQGEDVLSQCQSALDIIGKALAEVGGSFADVVRVNYYLPDASEFAPCWPLLAETFGANPPAATMIETGLIDPKYRIEIEVTALAPRSVVAGDRVAARVAATDEPVALHPAIPIIRCFDGGKAQDFYLDYLGFCVDWEHRHAPDLPLYQQVSRSGCLLHLSEHHGDAAPGGRSFIPMLGLGAFHAELQAKTYPNLNPEIETVPWGLQMTLTDPFGNRLTFCEQTVQDTGP